jgi:phosphopantetheinyl transferase (holo-ACP synthase)
MKHAPQWVKRENANSLDVLCLRIMDVLIRGTCPVFDSSGCAVMCGAAMCRQFSTGIALVMIDTVSMRDMISSTPIRKYLFSSREQEYSKRGRDSYARYAARLAAKFAYLMLHPEDSRITWSTLNVKHDARGAPILMMGNAPKDKLSLSHDRGVAVAILMRNGKLTRPSYM